MTTNTLIRIFWNLRSVLQDIYGRNVLITSIYVRIKGLCLWYEGVPNAHLNIAVNLTLN